MGGPYPSKTASIGLVPVPKVDIPICAVFILLYLIGFVSHITLFRRNLARGHKFIFSGMIGGFCMSRVVTNILRIVWATRPTNVRVVIAANIFVNAGVLLLYIVNFVLAIRMLKSAVPSKRLASVVDKGAKPFFAIIILMLAMLITTVVQSVYTLDANIHRIDRDIQLAAQTYFVCFAFASLPILAVATYLRDEQTHKPFGSGSWNDKLVRLVFTSLVATFIAGFRAGTTWETPRPATNPPWYDAKWCLYVFNFTLEIVIVYTFLFSRVDLHFHVAPISSSDEENQAPSQFYAVSLDGNWRPISKEESRSREVVEQDQQRIGRAIGSSESVESFDEKK